LTTASKMMERERLCAQIQGNIYFCEGGPIHGGNVWGSGPYTYISNRCKSARHAGVVDENGGFFEVVTCTTSPHFYPSSTSNGVTTLSWGRHHSAFNIRKANPESIPKKLKKLIRTVPSSPNFKENFDFERKEIREKEKTTNKGKFSGLEEQNDKLTEENTILHNSILDLQNEKGELTTTIEELKNEKKKNFKIYN